MNYDSRALTVQLEKTMHFLLNKATLVTFGLLQTISAHTTFTNFFVDGIDQGNGTCVRMSKVMGQQTFPIASITGDDMACGTFSESPALLVMPMLSSCL